MDNQTGFMMQCLDAFLFNLIKIVLYIVVFI